MKFSKTKNSPVQKGSIIVATNLHPAECGKKMRFLPTQIEKPWASVGIKFDVNSNNSVFKLITIFGSTPADWTIVTERNCGVRSRM